MTEEVSIALSTSKASSFQKRERDEVDVDALLAEIEQLRKENEKLRASRNETDIQNFTFIVETFERSTDALSGTFYKLVTVPEFVYNRYALKDGTTFYCRKCYHSLFELFKVNVLKSHHTSMLFSGVPGIGKSMFSIYLLIRLLLDDSFPRKEILFEHERGVYHKVTLIQMTERADSQSKFIDFNLQIGITQKPDRTALIFSDLISELEPAKLTQCNCIFSSPNPKRYKQSMRVSSKYTYTMPTWSYEELRLVDDNVDNWRNRFLKAGGVPRIVFSEDSDDIALGPLEAAIRDKGADLIRTFHDHGFGAVDDKQNYAIVHINPLPNSDNSDYDYQTQDLRFSTDYVFLKLSTALDNSLLNEMKSIFNRGLAKGRFGPQTAGIIFENMVLRSEPIAEKTIALEPLTANCPQRSLTLPRSTILPREWMSQNVCLEPDLFYIPIQSNLASVDAFCVVTTTDGFSFIGLQLTVSSEHPVKAHGLVSILKAYSREVQKKITEKLLVFVLSPGESMKKEQTLTSVKEEQLKICPMELRNLQQYWYQHRFSEVTGNPNPVSKN